MNNVKPLNIAELNISASDSDKIFSFLSADNSTDYQQPVDTISYIRNGISKKSVFRVLEKTGLPPTQLFNILHIDLHQPIQFDNQEKLSAEQSNFLYEFTRLYIRVLDVLGDKKTLDQWLNRPNLALGEKLPIELLDTIEGFRLVDNLLAQIEYGFYS